MRKKVFILEQHMNDKYEVDFEIDGYTHFRAFHACRPLQINDYLKNGINPICYDSARQDVKDRIVCDYVSEEKALTKFERKWSDFEDMHKQVWLQMNKNLLLEGASHYLIYGSEFINSLAMSLSCRDRLKHIGIPTIFYCDIPKRDINPKTLSNIQDGINKGYTYDIGISVKNVNPSNITDYEHPTKRLVDPYGGSYRPDYKLLKEYGYMSSKISV